MEDEQKLDASEKNEKFAMVRPWDDFSCRLNDGFLNPDSPLPEDWWDKRYMVPWVFGVINSDDVGPMWATWEDFAHFRKSDF